MDLEITMLCLKYKGVVFRQALDIHATGYPMSMFQRNKSENK